MSSGIPCCKAFTITIGPNSMDCGGYPSNLSDLVWTYTNSITLVPPTNLAGASPQLNFTTGAVPQTNVVLTSVLCNPTTSPVVINADYFMDDPYDPEDVGWELHNLPVISGSLIATQYVNPPNPPVSGSFVIGTIGPCSIATLGVWIFVPGSAGSQVSFSMNLSI